MERKFWWFAGAGAGIWSLIIGGLQVWKFQSFGYNGLDLGIYVQVVWSIGHELGFASSIHDPSYFGDHLELWLYPLAWLFRLWAHPLLILWVQTLALASAVFPLALIIRRRLGSQAALIGSLIFLLHPLLYNAAMYEFHGLAFALPLLCWSIAAYEWRRLGWWLLCLGCLLLVREDMPLLVAGWSLYAAADRRWTWALVPIVPAVAWFIFAQQFIGHHNPVGGYKYLAFYRVYGDSFADIVTYPFRHLLQFLNHILSPNNFQVVLGFLVSFGFLPLWKRKRLLPLAFVAIPLLLNGASTRGVLLLHYVIPYLPFLAWATIGAIQRIKSQPPAAFRGLNIRPALYALLIAGPLYAHLAHGPLAWPWTPQSDQGFTSPAIIRSFVRQIRPDERVITTFNTLPSLAARQTVYSLNYVYLGRRQYTEIPYVVPGPIDAALIDWQQLYHYQFFYRTTLFEGKTGAQRIAELLEKNNLKLVDWVDSVALYRRDGQDPYEPTVPITTTAGQDMGPVQLLGHSPAQTSNAEISVSFDWATQKVIERPISIRFKLEQNGKIAWASARLLGQGVHPAVDWQPGEAWRTNYRLAPPDSLQGRFTLKAEIVELDGSFRLDRWRTFRPVINHVAELGSVDVGDAQL